MARQDQAPWRDEAVLRRKYVEEGNSARTVGDDLGCSDATVLNWLERHGIETRPSNREKPASFYISKGYAFAESRNDKVRIHRLVAVAEHGFDAVAGNVVHHKNGFRRDNRPSNLEVMANDEHSLHHGRKWDGDEELVDEVTLRELYHEQGLSLQDVADELGCCLSTAWDRMDQFGIETRPSKRQMAGTKEWHDASVLRELYHCQGLTQAEVAEELGCSPTAIVRWMKRHGIETR